MKLLFIIICFYCFNFQNLSYINIKDKKSENNIIKSSENPKDKIIEYLNEIMDIFLELIISGNEKINRFKKYLEYFNRFEDNSCISFIQNAIFYPKYGINLIAKKSVRSGFASNSIETEDECLESNEVYILLKGNYTKDYIYSNINDSSNQRLLFVERFTFDHELCLWNYCKNVYIYNNSEIVREVEPIINDLFNLEHFELTGVNYKINQSTSFELEHKNDSYEYFLFLKVFLLITSIILIICTFFSTCFTNEDEKKNEDIRVNEKKISQEEVYNSIQNDSTIFSQENNYLFQNNSKYENLNSYKFINAFDVVNNFLLLNKKKEPLSNQNSLTELNGLIFIILFFILLIENVYIIIKYIDKGTGLFIFLKSNSFFIIKISSSAYESYKIICGIIFGFKFINYYEKEDFNCKRYFKFLFKFIPYSIIFLILYFIFQFHSVEIVSFLKKSLRNHHISKTINDCYYCHQNHFNIFNILMFQKYNTTDSIAAQYDGCPRNTLFTISEFLCYISILILMAIFLKVKSKILELIFFIINLLILSLTYILTPEGKDFKFYTVSRLFGLSASIALPYLFFPLYYIGFNIGIIYYYNQNQAKIYNELNSEENSYIPFEYCFKLSLFIKGIKGKIKNCIMILCVIFIIIISNDFSFLIRNKNELFFEINSFTRFLYVYDNILCGIFFSIFITIYLSLSEESFFRIVFSSKLLIFVNKIPFIAFNIFLTFLKIFHGFNTQTVHLSTINFISSSFSLYFNIICVLIIFAIAIFFPIKWIFYFITKGFNYDEYE